MAIIRSLAIPFLVITLFALLALFGWGALRKVQLDNGSQETAIVLLETSFSSCSAEAIVAAAHPQWLLSMPESSIRGYLESAMETLGPLQAMTSITGTSTAGILPLPGEDIEAYYVVNMELGVKAFETVIDLRLSNGEWLITNLVLNADALME